MQIAIRRRLIVAVSILLSIVILVSNSAQAVERVATPNTPPGKQVAWLVDASKRLPIKQKEARQHLSSEFLKEATLKGFNSVFLEVAGKKGIVLTSYKGDNSTAEFAFTALKKPWVGQIAVDKRGKISGLGVIPAAPSSWEEVNKRVSGLAPSASFAAFRIDGNGKCEEISGKNSQVARPTGSTFKLYVLGSLAHAIERGKGTWQEKLSIRDDWKAGTEGELDQLPAGTKLTLQQHAEKMISISDNTATDHLMRRIGRGSVERQQVRFGMADPSKNLPMLTTRQMGHLKSTNYPQFADKYIPATRSERRNILANQIDKLPIPTFDESWTRPRKIDAIEWFASPTDVCNAYSGLHQQSTKPELSNIDKIMSINDGGLGLDDQKWKQVWFKGGSESGVLALNYLATNSKNEKFVVSIMISDKSRPISEMSVIEALILAKGAFDLTDLE